MNLFKLSTVGLALVLIGWAACGDSSRVALIPVFRPSAALAALSAAVGRPALAASLAAAERLTLVASRAVAA